MNSRCRAVDGGDGQEGKNMGNLHGSSHNIGNVSKFAKRHLHIDLNGPAAQHEPEHEHQPKAPATPVPVVNNVEAPLPIEEVPRCNLEEAFDGPIDWASLCTSLDGRKTFYKPQPMTEAERNENERRLALNFAVYEAQERDDAYYQGRLDNLGSKHDLPLENQSFDLDTDPCIPSLWQE